MSIPGAVDGSRRTRRIWLCAASLTGLIAAALGRAYAWMVLLGLGRGTVADLAITFIVLRSPDTRHAAQLSSMAQSGYLLGRQ